MRPFGAGYPEPKVNAGGAGLDRLATGSEARYALELYLSELLDPENTYEAYKTKPFAMNASDQILRNEFVWMALASETPESKRN